MSLTYKCPYPQFKRLKRNKEIKKPIRVSQRKARHFKGDSFKLMIIISSVVSGYYEGLCEEFQMK